MSWAVTAAAGVPILWAVLLFNHLRRRQVAVGAARANVDASLTMRADLIVQLQGATAGYMSHETQALKAIAGQRGVADAALRVTVEDNADLKASDVVLRLQEELVRVEDQLAFTRAYLRERTQAYNDAVSTVPGKWVAKVLGIATIPYSDRVQGAS